MPERPEYRILNPFDLPFALNDPISQTHQRFFRSAGRNRDHFQVTLPTKPSTAPPSPNGQCSFRWRVVLFDLLQPDAAFHR
ncbi:hypothetical protein [Azospirillum doebereinerae]